MVSNYTGGTIRFYSTNELQVQFPSSCTTTDLVRNYLATNPILIQYKLSSSYTEKVINNVYDRGEPVLLWRASNYHNSQSSGTVLPTPGLGNFKYIIVGWQPAPNGNAIQYIKSRVYNDSGTDNTSIPFNFVDNNGEIWHRYIKINSGTWNDITVYGAYSGTGTTENSNRCVVVEIWGTNLL